MLQLRYSFMTRKTKDQIAGSKEFMDSCFIWAFNTDQQTNSYKQLVSSLVTLISIIYTFLKLQLL
jgi:hypothetical protein